MPDSSNHLKRHQYGLFITRLHFRTRNWPSELGPFVGSQLKGPQRGTHTSKPLRTVAQTYHETVRPGTRADVSRFPLRSAVPRCSSSESKTSRWAAAP